MAKQRLCVHCRPVREVSDETEAKTLLTRILRHTGNCPDCDDNRITVDALLEVQEEVPVSLRITANSWDSSDLTIGSLMYVQVDMGQWNGRLPGNIGLNGHFVGSLVQIIANGQLRFRVGRGYYLTLKRRNILKIAEIIPAHHILTDKPDCWMVDSATFSLIPAQIKLERIAKETSRLSLIAA